MTAYGADPTGEKDSTDAILGAIADAVQGPGNGELMKGIVNLGGVRIDLDGGIYTISHPLRLPIAGRGNLMVNLLTPGYYFFNIVHFPNVNICVHDQISGP